MVRPVTTASGQAKISIALRVDPELKAWADSRGLNLSEVLGDELTRRRLQEISSALVIEEFLHG